MSKPVVLERREVDAGQRLQRPKGLRPLDGDEGVSGADVDGDGVTDRLDVLDDVCVIAIDVLGVDNQEKVLRSQSVHEQVVDERALRGQQTRVLCLSDGES